MPATQARPVHLEVSAPAPEPLPAAASVRGLPTAHYQLAHGVPGAWGGVLTGLALRSVLIGGGLALGGVRGMRAVTGAVVSSALISALLVASHAATRPSR